MPSESNNKTIYARVTKSFAYDSRRRAGIDFGTKPISIEVTDEQLKAIENDPCLQVLTKKQFEDESVKHEAMENSQSIQAVKKQKQSQSKAKKAKGKKKSDDTVEVTAGVSGNSAIARKANAKSAK